MYTLFLWFNMLSFTLMFAATGCSMIRQIKEQYSWQRNYIIYQICWAFWLLLSTFSFFQYFFIDNPGPTLSQALSWIRIVFSFVIFNLIPVIVYEITGKRWKLWQALVSSGILLVIVAMYLIIASLFSVVLLNTGYHLFLAIITLSGFRKYRLKKSSEKKIFIQNFLLLTSVYFLSFSILNIAFLFLPQGWEQEIGIAVIGLFTFSWASIDIIRFILDWKQDSDQTVIVPESWGVSPREKEILMKLLAGSTNREISEELFISMRTVEAHTYSIYRKCGVKSRIELLHKLKK